MKCRFHGKWVGQKGSDTHFHGKAKVVQPFHGELGHPFSWNPQKARTPIFMENRWALFFDKQLT